MTIFIFTKDQPSLAELIHPIAAMGCEEWPYRPHPSKAGPEICSRKLSYQANEIAGKDPHGRFLVVLDDATWHEELVLNWSRKRPFNCIAPTARYLWHDDLE